MTWTTGSTTGQQMATQFNKLEGNYRADCVSYSKVIASTPLAQGASLELISSTILTEADRNPNTPIAGANGVVNPYKPSIPVGANYLNFPAPINASSGLTLLFRVTFGIAVGSIQTLTVQLRRQTDLSVIASFPLSRDADRPEQMAAFPSFIYGATDPFVVGGVRFTLFNGSGSAVNVTGPVGLLTTWNHMQPAIG